MRNNLIKAWICAVALAVSLAVAPMTRVAAQNDDDGPIAPSYYDDEDLLTEEGEEEPTSEDDDFLDELDFDTIFDEEASDDPNGVKVDSLPTLRGSPQLDAEDYGAAWDTAVFRGLDKVTARISVFEAPLNEPVAYGRFEVTVRRCNKRPPEETPNTTAFVEVVETMLDDQTQPIFSGWMFASSPGLNAVEHPVYDVWLIDCKANAPVMPVEVQSSEGEMMNLDSLDAEELTLE